MLTAIIVEDELASRETLASYLAKYCPDVSLAAQAESVKTGLEAIRQHQPDIVFLDVEMPFGNAFDLLEQVENITFETIFVTAYSHYAVKALNFSASYYILKPIDIDELIAAVEKVKENKARNDHAFHTRILIDNIKNLSQQQQKVVLPVLDGFEVVQVKDIIRCQANGNFTDFFLTSGAKKMICRTLKFYDNILSELGFVRVHKSHLVNVEYITGYKKGKGGQVTLSNGDVVEVSPQKKQDLLDYF
ncbi:MAG: LytTR family DNA-binding domain-containing protein [Bacteroidia bacterium]